MMSEKSHAAEVTPSSIGRYQITAVLGYGAMGAVYQAFDPIIKRPLAIKTIRLEGPPQNPQHKDFITRFYQEARISGTLSHPNIVTLFDIGEEGGMPFLAMEYVEGRTISQLLEEGTRFEPERVISIASQVAAGLDYAHSRGIVHRDIKPSNLIVQDGDRVKVTDFGIAKLIDSEITHAGTLLGTPSYMSPEQAMGEKLDGRSDIFSLGVCAFEMLSGQQPFPGNNVTSILYKLVHVDPIEPAGLEMSGLIPQKWREVFRKVLAKKPEDRHPTAGAFVRDLEFCLGSWFSGLGEEEAFPAVDGSTVTVAGEPGCPADVAVPGDGAATARKLEPDSGADTLALPARPELADVKPDNSATVQVKGVADPPSGPPADTPGDVPPGPTEVLEPPAPTQTVASPSEPTGTAAVATPRPLPVGWILTAAVGLFVVAAAVVTWMLWSRGSPAPVEARALPTPTPLPMESPVVPRFGSLRVGSEPPGALVRLDGEDRGHTPLELGEVPLGAHQVRIELEGYERQDHEVSLTAESAVTELQATLERRRPSLGTARFTSVPEGGEVAVDGESVGTTPLDGVRLRPGRHRVEIVLEGHEPWSGSVEVTAGQPARLEAKLVPVPPTVSAPPEPPPVDTAKVYENKHGEVDQVAKKRSGSSPSYPSDQAPPLRSGERVSVTLSFLVTETGEVAQIEVTESAGPILDEVVTSAVSQWRYDPATIRDVPVKVRIVFRQTFLGG
jgi:serine/threonine-protein kinase